MAKTDEKIDPVAVDPFGDPEATVPEQADPATSEIPVADNPVGPEAPVEELPPVEVKLADDFEAEGDVYISIAELPAELADENDRYKLPKTGTVELPAEVAAAFAESTAVEVAE